MKQVPQLRENEQLLKIVEYSCYLSGIAICSLMNIVIHLLTNESLVHCAHDAPDSISHAHSHSHAGNHDNHDLESLNYSLSTHKSSHDHHTHSHSHPPNENSSSSSDEHNVPDDKILNETPTSQLPPAKECKSPHSIIENEPPADAVSRPSKAKPNYHIHTSDTEPLVKHLTHAPKKTMSLMDLSLKKLKGETMTGQCYGDIDCCTDEILANNHLHLHNPNKLYFCTKPSEENLLFFPDSKHMITDRAELASRYPDLDIHSPLIANDNVDFLKSSNHPVYDSTNNIPHQHRTFHNGVADETVTNKFAQSHGDNTTQKTTNQRGTEGIENTKSSHQTDYYENPTYFNSNKLTQGESAYSTPYYAATNNRADEEEDDDDEEEEEEEEEEEGDHITHHHHIKTPLSRLLSIGLQTIMAITLHKFPEGFIMYSTSRTNPELGMSIFLSMFIHNFVEGFTMTLPIYIALNSRAKALLISGTLGSLSQPIGACIGYYMFKGKRDMNDPFSIALVAVLLAITSGFLTFISLQMFASAIGFGGRQEKVLKWSFIGIFLICLSNVLL